MKTKGHLIILIFTFLSAILLLGACTNYNKKLEGNWVIDKVYYVKNIRSYNLLTNSFELYPDHTCFLPGLGIADRHTVIEKGMWNTFERNDTVFLQIKTANPFFDRVFKISNYRDTKDPVSFGILTKVTMASDSLTLDCTQAKF